MTPNSVAINALILSGLLLISGLSTDAFSKPLSKIEIKIFKINGKEIPLLHDKTHHLLVSPGCVTQNAGLFAQNQNCAANQILKVVSLKKYKNQLSGGINPGSLLCNKMNGKIWIALDSRGNQNSICELNDGTHVSSGTLHYHANQNDRRPPSHF